MSDGYCLDACALLAYFKGEPGAEAVETKLQAADKREITLYLHKLNFLEVYYKILKIDKTRAQSVYDTILKLPITIIVDFDDKLFMEAARLKDQYQISLADSIALGYANTNQLSLITCDHNEFDKVEKSEPLKFEWIR
jgi:predicted nucleic acid-binding protein